MADSRNKYDLGVDKNSIDKLSVVMESLLTGLRVRIADYEFELDSDLVLCVVGTKTDSNDPSTESEVLLKYNFGECGLSEYLALISVVTDYEYDVIMSNLALNKI